MRWLGLVYANILAGVALVGVEHDALVLRTFAVALPGIAGLATYLWSRNRTRIRMGADTLTSIGVLGQFILPPLYLVSVPLEGPLAASLLPYLDLFPDVAFAALLGQTVFLAGYELTERRERRRGEALGAVALVPPSSPVAFMRLVLPLVGLVWLSRAALLGTASYYHLLPSEFMLESPLYSILAQISGFGTVVPAGLWAISFTAGERGPLNGGRWRVAAISFTTAELLWYVPSGSREPVAIVVVTLLAAYVWARQAVPKKVVGTVVAGLLVLLAFMDHYRYAVAELALPTAIRSAVVGDAFRESGIRFLEEDGTGMQWLTRSVARLADGRSVAAILGKVPEVVPYLDGDSYARLVWVFVPRFMYPNKPTMIMPLDPALLEANEGGSSPTTLIGEAYMNFGWLGLLLIMPVVGCASRVYDRVFSRRLSHPAWAAVYLAMAATVARLPVQPVAVWLGALLKAALLAVLLAAWGRRLLGFASNR